VADLDAKPNPAAMTWSAGSGSFDDIHSFAPLFTCEVAGSFEIRIDAFDGLCSDDATITVECAPFDESPTFVRVNEVESSDGGPGDWVELYNAGFTSADLSGWIFKDNDDSHRYALPAGTTIAPGDYLALDESLFGFGLGSSDAARLYLPDGSTLIDASSWSVHAVTTYGRCPNGVGPLTGTRARSKGKMRDCPGETPVLSWPGADEVSPVDVANTFGPNMSGLNYQPASDSTPAYL
jgi:hypothetical protein